MIPKVTINSSFRACEEQVIPNTNNQTRINAVRDTAVALQAASANPQELEVINAKLRRLSLEAPKSVTGKNIFDLPTRVFPCGGKVYSYDVGDEFFIINGLDGAHVFHEKGDFQVCGAGTVIADRDRLLVISYRNEPANKVSQLNPRNGAEQKELFYQELGLDYESLIFFDENSLLMEMKYGGWRVYKDMKDTSFEEYTPRAIDPNALRYVEANHLIYCDHRSFCIYALDDLASDPKIIPVKSANFCHVATDNAFYMVDEQGDVVALDYKTQQKLATFALNGKGVKGLWVQHNLLFVQQKNKVAIFDLATRKCLEVYQLPYFPKKLDSPSNEIEFFTVNSNEIIYKDLDKVYAFDYRTAIANKKKSLYFELAKSF